MYAASQPITTPGNAPTPSELMHAPYQPEPSITLDHALARSNSMPTPSTPLLTPDDAPT